MGREKEGRYGTSKKLQETQNVDSLIHSRNFQFQLSFYVLGKAYIQFSSFLLLYFIKLYIIILLYYI